MMHDLSAIELGNLVRAYPAQRIRPLSALTAAFRLIKNPQDTRQVSLVEIAFGGCSPRGIFERFVSSPTGKAIIRERRSLVKTLDDHAYLRGLPENAFGRHYLAFMEHEGLSAQGLMDETAAFTDYLANMPEEVRIFSNYTQRGAHDLYHVLAGYGRDELGEVCVLAMGYEQLKIRGYRVISTVGPLVVRKYLRRSGAGAEGVFAAAREASAIGRNALWLPGIDMEAALAEDLDALRRRLNISRPVRYDQVLARLRSRTDWQDGPFAAARPKSAG